jgi:hypothetical protein
VDYLAWVEVDVGHPAGVKGGSTSVPADVVEVLLVADVTRMLDLRVREGATSTLTLMVEGVLVVDIPRVWAEKGSTSLLVEAILVVVGVLRVRVGEDSTSTASSMVEVILVVDVPRVVVLVVGYTRGGAELNLNANVNTGSAGRTLGGGVPSERGSTANVHTDAQAH